MSSVVTVPQRLLKRQKILMPTLSWSFERERGPTTTTTTTTTTQDKKRSPRRERTKTLKIRVLGVQFMQQQQQWKSITAKLGSALAPCGLDVCAPLQLGWYHATVHKHLHLAAPGEQRADAQTLAILVGNSKALWSPFLSALRKRQWHPLKDAEGNVEQSGCGHCQGTPGLRGWDKHPVDAYVVSVNTILLYNAVDHV
jgi:hypothetical protein